MAIYCFDLDGTIFDSLNGIYYSLEHACNKFNLKLISKQKFKKHIGPPLKNYLNSVITSKIDDSLIKEIINEFRVHHDNEGYKYYSIYPNMINILGLLKKENHLIILTNKPYKITLKSINHFKIKEFFRETLCPDKSSIFLKEWTKGDIKSKNNYLKYIDRNTEKKIKKYFVGDTISDYYATKENSFEFIYASYGYGEKLKFKDINTINEPLDLNKFLKNES
tara:strand:- start:446 stop:1111 length:666 start_codon:yes stop_codon:yes gene_type:complete